MVGLSSAQRQQLLTFSTCWRCVLSSSELFLRLRVFASITPGSSRFQRDRRGPWRRIRCRHVGMAALKQPLHDGIQPAQQPWPVGELLKKGLADFDQRSQIVQLLEPLLRQLLVIEPKYTVPGVEGRDCREPLRVLGYS